MTSMITARVDANKRKKAEMVFSEVGLTTSGAVNLFICAVAMTGGIPFPIGISGSSHARVSQSNGEATQPRGRLNVGLADGKYLLPDDFDSAFDSMDGEIAKMFS